eukprot:5669130-Alexandrium_andersonii.AAC.1
MGFAASPSDVPVQSLWNLEDNPCCALVESRSAPTRYVFNCRCMINAFRVTPYWTLSGYWLCLQ